MSPGCQGCGGEGVSLDAFFKVVPSLAVCVSMRTPHIHTCRQEVRLFPKDEIFFF